MLFSSLVVSALSVGSALAALKLNIPNPKRPVDLFYDRLRSFPDATVIPIAISNVAGQRYDINALQSLQDQRQFTLLIQGFAAFEKQEQTAKTSYYALSGIHGRPFKSWNDENTCQRCVGNTGYCVHGGMMFATWHRLYLSLFEQYLWRNAYVWMRSQKIPAAEMNAWEQALAQLRVPFWDWTKNGGKLPSSVTSDSLSLYFPGGKRENVVNPLNRYIFNWRKGQDDLGPIGQRFSKSSVRSPDSRGNQNNAESNRVMQGQWGSLSQGVYDMIMNPSFSSYRNMVSKLRNMHDVVHGAFGNGYMTYIDVAAFDPIFWLHHCMIDRLFDMWQAVNPNTRFTESARFHGTFEIATTSPDAATTNLMPFRGTRFCANEKKQCAMNSNDAWSSMALGYFYPETRDRRPASVRAWVNANAKQTRRVKRAIAGGAENNSMTGEKILSDHQWKATVNTDPTACNTTYFVHLFVGEPSSNPQDWLTQPELVGSHVVFGMAPEIKLPRNATLFGNGTDFATNGKSGAMNGMQMAHVQEGSIMLNRHLDASDAVDTNCPTVIEPYLTKNLNIRVQLATGEEVPISKLPSLKVGVQSQPFSPPRTPEDAPTFGKETIYRSITKDIVGGLGRCGRLGVGLPW